MFVCVPLSLLRFIECVLCVFLCYGLPFFFVVHEVKIFEKRKARVYVSSVKFTIAYIYIYIYQFMLSVAQKGRNFHLNEKRGKVCVCLEYTEFTKAFFVTWNS